jgi:hypothetical protein
MRLPGIIFPKMGQAEVMIWTSYQACVNYLPDSRSGTRCGFKPHPRQALPSSVGIAIAIQEVHLFISKKAFYRQ